MVEAKGNPGERLDVDWTVENVGDTGEQLIELVRLDTGEVVDSVSVELVGGQSTSEVLSWLTPDDIAEDRYSIRLESVNDNVSFDVDIGDVIPNSVVSRPDDDDSQSGYNGEDGLEIELKSDWPSIGARISNNTNSPTRAYLHEVDNGSLGTLVDDVDISGISSGDAFTFDNVDLISGGKYTITLDAEGADYTVGYYTGSNNYPYTSDDVDITARVRTGEIDQDLDPIAINDIGNVGF